MSRKRKREEFFFNVDMKTLETWINNKEFYSKNLHSQIFEIQLDGVVCKECSQFWEDHPEIVKGRRGFYVGVKGNPDKYSDLSGHIQSDQHAHLALGGKSRQQIKDKQQTMPEIIKERKAIESRIKLQYFTIKNNLSISLISGLQKLFGDLCREDSLTDFGHLSHLSSNEFIEVIADFFRKKLYDQLLCVPIYAVTFDETTDIHSNSLFITFLRYFSDGIIKETFLDIVNLGEGSNTGIKLADCLKDVMLRNKLPLNKIIGVSCDGASSLQGESNGMIALLRSQLPWLQSVHCCAHRLSLACTDVDKSLELFHQCESALTSLYTFFSRSTVNHSMHEMIHKVDNSKSIQLQKAIHTRWWSSEASLSSAVKELPYLWAVISELTTKRNPTATGLFQITRSMDFLIPLFILHSVLRPIKKLFNNFQKSVFNFSMLNPSLEECFNELENIKKENTPFQELLLNWNHLTSICPMVFDDSSIEKSVFLLEKYVSALVKEIKCRFPDNDILSCFSIFDPSKIPNDENEFLNYGVMELRKLLNVFEFFISKEKHRETEIHWSSFKYSLKGELSGKSLFDVCKLLYSDNIYSAYNHLSKLALIAITIPFTSVWPERGLVN